MAIDNIDYHKLAMIDPPFYSNEFYWLELLTIIPSSIDVSLNS